MAVAWCTECSAFTVSVMLLTIPLVQGQLQGSGKFSNPEICTAIVTQFRSTHFFNQKIRILTVTPTPE